MSLLRLIAGLVGARVNFVVIGGVAARAHGAVSITENLDICYDPDSSNVARLANRLSEWAAYPRGIEPGLPFIMDERTFETAPVMILTTDQGDLNVYDAVAGVGDFERVLAASVDVEAGDLRFYALDLPGLIAAKHAAGRPRDLADIPELEALLELGKKGG